VTASAYQQYREVSALARLGDATSSLIARLTIDELAYVDNLGNKHDYVLDPSKLGSLTFMREIGGDNFGFQISIYYKRGDEEEVLGPYGAAPPKDKTNCSIAVACTLWSNGRFLPAKLGVIAWYA
jgi:hypothetical protein